MSAAKSSKTYWHKELKWAEGIKGFHPSLRAYGGVSFGHALNPAIVRANSGPVRPFSQFWEKGRFGNRFFQYREARAVVSTLIPGPSPC